MRWGHSLAGVRSAFVDAMAWPDRPASESGRAQAVELEPLHAASLTSIRYLIEDRDGTVTAAELPHTDEE